MTKTLLSFGHGYSAKALTRILPDDWRVIGTTRSEDKAAALMADGTEPRIWPGADLKPALDAATHLLISAGPSEAGDPVLNELRNDIAAFAKVRNGTARRIIKQGQVFSRIHVADIAQVLAASIERPNPGAIYNLCDNDPAPPEDVIGYAAELLGLPIPPGIGNRRLTATAITVKIMRTPIATAKLTP